MTDQKFAHYEILGLLGRGGMGEVHRARDTKLGREVAIKLLPEDFALDPERLARFTREAKVLASLQHPNIAGIFGLEEDHNRVFLAMELAEGSDLTDRIAQGAIPEEEVLDIARQLAAGLEEAHEKGVVHRDLKPANIKLGNDGKVKILDFGLARAYAGESSQEENPEHSPTITAAMSHAGVILGTAAYMSPEQARGRKVDRRADIWSFGAVVFEMLTGKRLFEGETISDTLAAVLRQDIEWDELPDNTSPGIRRLLERCLERDPLRRLRDIGEARVFLEAGAQDSSLLASVSSMDLSSATGFREARAGHGLPLWGTVAIAATLAVLGTLLGWQVLGRPKAPPLFNTALPSPADQAFHLISARPGPAAISPDGTMVVYSARDNTGTFRLYLRHLDSPDGTTISGTEGASYPFWSPDNRYVGFFDDDESKLKKVAVSGGPPVSLCEAGNLKGGTWNQDGVILFAESHDSGIFQVPASGGEPVSVTSIKETENSHRHPRFLPGGEQFLFLARVPIGGPREHRVMLGSLNGEEPRLIASSQVAAEYSKGHLLTVREGILLATPFDLKSGALGEGGTPLVEDILIISNDAACAVYSSTVDGMLVYQVSKGKMEKSLQWAGASVTSVGKIGEPGEFFRPRISPDGSQAVVEMLDPATETSDLWLVNLETGLRNRFTFDPGNERHAVWTPDGTTVFYVSSADSTYQVLRQPVEGTGGLSSVYEATRNTVLSGMTPDGSNLMVTMNNTETQWDVLSLNIESGELVPIANTGESEYWGVVSPDGRWFAYNQSRQANVEVIVRPMVGGQRQWQIGGGEGLYPFWAPDGNTLYFITITGDLMATEVDGSGSTFRAGEPKIYMSVGQPEFEGLHICIHPDGKRILEVYGGQSDDESGYLQLVTDWKRGLAN